MDTTEAGAGASGFMARRVSLGWVVALGIVLAVTLVALVRTSRANEHTIKYWTKTVTGRVEVCNPKNADLAVSAPPGKFGIVEKNTGANICIYKADGSFANTSPWVNRLDADARSDPSLFKGGPWVLTLARIGSDTPNVIAAHRGVIEGPLNEWCRQMAPLRPLPELVREAIVGGNGPSRATFFVAHPITATSEVPRSVRADFALMRQAIELATRAARAPAGRAATKGSPALAAASRIERACSDVGA